MPTKKIFAPTWQKYHKKINLKGQRKEWFGLLPVCCFKENTHGLNWVVLVYHRWTKQQFSPRAFHRYQHGVTKTTSCFGTGRSTIDFHQLCSILWLERFLCAFSDEKDGGCYESASCFENVARRRQQHGSFRLPVLLEVDSKEYSDPVAESTGEERKKHIPTFFLGFLITKSFEQCFEDSPNLISQAETLVIESLGWWNDSEELAGERICVVVVCGRYNHGFFVGWSITLNPL